MRFKSNRQRKAVMAKFKYGRNIYVGDLGEAKISKRGNIHAFYINEEDGTKSWQLHPDEFRGDTILKSVKVIPKEKVRPERAILGHLHTKVFGKRINVNSTPRSGEISENISKGKYYAKIQRKYGYVPKRFLK